jgi:hypothetical protein
MGQPYGAPHLAFKLVDRVVVRETWSVVHDGSPASEHLNQDATAMERSADPCPRRLEHARRKRGYSVLQLGAVH